MGFLEEEQQVAREVDKLVALLQESELVQNFKTVEKQARNHAGLKELEEQIKAAQKDAVNFAHYDKTEAEKMAIQEIDRLNQAFKNHPLVQDYRNQLIEADELLQHISTTIQKEVNEAIEKEEENATKNETHPDDGTILRH